MNQRLKNHVSVKCTEAHDCPTIQANILILRKHTLKYFTLDYDLCNLFSKGSENNMCVCVCRKCKSGGGGEGEGREREAGDIYSG